MIEDATIRDVERALGELRGALVMDGEHFGLRTSVMTHMAWVPEPWVDAAMDTLGGLQERHPSRTIVVFPDPAAERDALDADVDLRCFTTGGEGGSVCFEVIQLHLRGPRASFPGSVVAPLLITDLPVFLRWRGELAFGASELDELLGLADRLIVDCSEWTEPERDLARLPELFDRAAVSDIAWLRLDPWRLTLARLWPGIARLERLRVVGPRAEALLLAGWLGGRLGRDVELEHVEADELDEVEVDGEPVQPVAAGPESSSDLLSAELDLFGRDPIYEEAVRSFSRVTT